MADAGEEQAQEMKDASIWDTAIQLARNVEYAQIKIKCPGCRVAVLGQKFEKHAEECRK